MFTEHLLCARHYSSTGATAVAKANRVLVLGEHTLW